MNISPFPSKIVHIQIRQDLISDNRLEKKMWSLEAREADACGRMPGRWYLNPALEGGWDLSKQHGAFQAEQTASEWCVDGGQCVHRQVHKLGC